MKTRLIPFLLLLLIAVAAKAQKPKNNTAAYFTGKWQLTALVHKTLQPQDMSKTYEFGKDSIIQMKSNRYQITGKYAYDEKTSTLKINLNGTEVLFHIIFLAPDKMQWHAVAAANDEDDGITERVTE